MCSQVCIDVAGDKQAHVLPPWLEPGFLPQSSMSVDRDSPPQISCRHTLKAPFHFLLPFQRSTYLPKQLSLKMPES